MRARFSPENLPPGTRIGAYVLGAKLGMGGGGVVYEARSPLGNAVALKISRYRLGRPGTPDSVMDGRFWRGHLCQGQLHGHPNVLQLYGFDRHPDPFGGWQYEVLELVPGGESITDWARRAQPSLEALLRAFHGIAVALGDMHWVGIRHRDIKPANILVGPDGVPKILDFNSATFFRAKPLTKPAASDLPCTEAYLPPEVCREVLRERWTGEARRFTYQPTGDLHGLGVILYEVLTGRYPFNLELDGMDLLVEIAHRTPKWPSAVNPWVPRELEALVMILLRKSPADRYQSAYAVAAELELLLGDTGRGDGSNPFPVPGQEAAPFPLAEVEAGAGPVRAGRPRRWAWLAVGALVLALALALAAWAWWRSGVQEPVRSGSSATKRVSTLGVLCTRMVPRIASSAWRVIHSPRPSPP